MSAPEVPRSGHCLRSEHEQCPHTAGVDFGGLRRRRPEAEHVLTVCTCDCHGGCSLVGRGTVTRHLWDQECTCPGAAAGRERRALMMNRRAELAEVLAGVQREGRVTARELESRLRSVYARHGEAPPPGMARWAEVVAAGTAPRGTRSLRLLWMGIRAVARSVGWAWTPAGGTDGGNRVEARKFHGAVAVVALLAALLTAAAARSSGRRRLPLGAGAAAAWLVTLVATSVGTAALQVARSLEVSAEDVPQSERTDATPV